MDRVRFRKGGQRAFFDLVIEKIQAPSLRGIISFGIEVSYSTLKNYYTGQRLMPRDLFEDLCELAGISPGEFDFEIIERAWGQRVGGKKSRRGQSPQADW